jgi:hypothetical protein
MIVIVCVDNSLGMLFNNRRQSRDSVLISKIIEMSASKRLLISEFSSSLFDGLNAVVNERFLDIAEDGDFCFVENCTLSPYVDKIEKLIVFKWNRDYPSDFCLDLDLSQWALISNLDFEGSSHEKITMEVYEK